MAKPDNILVIRLSSLGDVLMSIPAVKAIGDHFPEARITWLAEGSVADFLVYQRFIHRVIAFPRKALVQGLKKGRILEAKREMSRFLDILRDTDYDIVIDFHGIAKSVFFSLVARGTHRIGFGRMFAKEMSHLFYGKTIEGADKKMHKVDRNMLMAQHLGFAGPVPVVHLDVPDDAEAYVDQFIQSIDGPRPFIVVNPFSSKGTEFKRWPVERYAELISRITRGLDALTVILWGPDEEREARKLRDMTPGTAVLACPTTVPQLFALIRRAVLYIGGDTGVMHLAAAAHTPVVAIFGPTDVRINGPYGPDHKVVRRDVVICSPCKNKKCDERRCLTGIAVDEIFEQVSSGYRRRQDN